MHSLAGTIDRLAEHLAPAVVSLDELDGVRGICQRVPAAVTDCVFLERWLGCDATRVDLIFRVVRERCRILSGDDPASAVDPELRAQADWRRVERFAKAWALSNGALARDVEALWVEFDRGPGGKAAPDLAPRLFVDFAPEAFAQPSPEARLALLGDALGVLQGESVPEALVKRLRRLLGCLPNGANVPYVGAPLGGSVPGVRVCVLGLRNHEIPACLRAVGWPGDEEQLAAELLAPLACAKGGDPRSVALLHLDLAEGVGPRIGLEYAFARKGQMRGRVEETALLDCLVARGLCDGAVRDGLLRWPGASVELLPHEIWFSRLARRLSHVKLTYATGQPTHAKAYMCFFHELLGAGALMADCPALVPYAARDAADLRRAGAGSARSSRRAAVLSDSGRARLDRPPASTRQRDHTLRTILGEIPPGRRGNCRQRKLGRTRRMSMSTKEQQALQAILERTKADAPFRARLLADPRKAIEQVFGVVIPASFRVKFIEREPEVDALIVLPDFQDPNGELSNGDLESVAGGAPGEENPTWADGIEPIS